MRPVKDCNALLAAGSTRSEIQSKNLLIVFTPNHESGGRHMEFEHLHDQLVTWCTTAGVTGTDFIES